MIEELIKKENVLIRRLEKAKKPIIIYGAGGCGRRLAGYLRSEGIELACFCQTSVEKGAMTDGLPVYQYDEIRELFPEYMILIATILGTAEDILKYLMERGEKNEIYAMRIPFKVDSILLDYEFVEAKMPEFEEVYYHFADDESKELYIELLNYAVSGDGLPLLRRISGDSFFCKDILEPSCEYTYVDVGAYTGDTVMQFCLFVDNGYRRIIALEPDVYNYKKLGDFCEYARMENIEIYNIGGWSHKDQLKFYTHENEGYINSNFFKPTSDVAEQRDYDLELSNRKKTIVTKMDVDSIDNILGGREAGLIKINALASDFEVLCGAEDTIAKWRPRLVMEFGCRPDDLLRMPKFIKSLMPDYKLYLRQRRIFGDTKTVLYAV